MNHLQAPTVRDLEDAITIDLTENAVFAYVDPGAMAHKNLHDVHTFADLHSWLRVGLVPLLFKAYHPWSEAPAPLPMPTVAIPIEERFAYLQHNRLIGGVQLRQVRSEDVECKHQEVAEGLNVSCFST